MYLRKTFWQQTISAHAHQVGWPIWNTNRTLAIATTPYWYPASISNLIFRKQRQESPTWANYNLPFGQCNCNNIKTVTEMIIIHHSSGKIALWIFAFFGCCWYSIKTYVGKIQQKLLLKLHSLRLNLNGSQLAVICVKHQQQLLKYTFTTMILHLRCTDSFKFPR
jgi:hypothetical protein